MSYLNADLNRFAVKLRKAGWSDIDVKAFLSGINDIREVTELRKITELCERLVCLPQYRKYLGLLDEMCKFMVANEGQDICFIQATKENGVWRYVVG